MGTASTLEALKARHRRTNAGRHLPPPGSPSMYDRLMESLRDLTGQTFSWEQMVVAAWRWEPAYFGLAGFEDQYPDSNRVSTCLYGRRGLIRRGKIRRVGPKLFKLEG
jgi:hypothetical protein